jgi:hypothetical protein
MGIWGSVLSLLGMGQAHAEVEISAQYRNLLYVPQRYGVEGVADTNGIRLDIRSQGDADKIRFRGSFDAAYTFGDEDAMLLGSTLTGPEGIYAERTRIDLFRAFLQLKDPKSRAELTLGRQRIGWGMGLVLRPTNLFSPTDLFDPYQELRGVDALRGTIPLGDGTLLDGVVRLDDSSSRVQVGLQVGQKLASSGELNVSIGEDGIHGRQQVGVALRAGSGTSAWMEGIYRHQSASTSNRFADDEHSAQLEVGVEHSLDDDSLSIAAEYLLLSSGDAYGGGSYYADAVSDYRVLQGRHYAYVQGRLTPNQKVSFQTGLLVNLIDGSLAIQPRLAFTPLSAVDVSLGAQIFLGDGGDEFAREDIERGGDGGVVYYLLTAWNF